jgi:hypothetical protein
MEKRGSSSIGSGPVIFVGLLVVVALAITFAASPTFLPFKTTSVAHIGSIMATAILLALFVERTIEVVLLTTRAKDKQKLAIEAKSAQNLSGETAAKANETLASFTSDSLRIALMLGFLLGVLISAAGVRLIESFLEPYAVAEMTGTQYKFLALVDILVTGALIGGGANGLHRILDMFLSSVDAKRAEIKASASHPNK